MRHGYVRMMVLGLALAAMLAFAGLRAPTASAEGMGSCPMEPSIVSLRACVQHAAEMGLINSQVVTHSLLSKLDAAQEAVERGQPRVAIHLLKAFVREVRAQSGKHIDATHAAHMIAHAQLVIQALEESPTQGKN